MLIRHKLRAGRARASFGDVVDEEFSSRPRGAAAAAENEGEDEIAHAGAIRHDERAEHRALEAALAITSSAKSSERRGDEQRQKQPRRVRPLASIQWRKG